MTTQGNFGTLLDWVGGGLTMHEWRERLGKPAPWLAALLEQTNAYATHLPMERPGQHPRRVVRMPDGRFVAESPIRHALPVTISAEEVRLWKLNPSALHHTLAAALGLVRVQSDILSGECFGYIRTSPRGQVQVRLVSAHHDELINERIASFASMAAKPEVYLTPHEIVLGADTSSVCAEKRCEVSSLDACVDASGTQLHGSQRWQELATSFVAPRANKEPRRRSSVLLNMRKITDELEAERQARVSRMADAWATEQTWPQFEEFTQKELAGRAKLTEPTVSKLLHDSSCKHLLRMFKLVNDPETLWKISSKSLC